MVQFVMWGKTEQRRTAGKNLLNTKGETTIRKGIFDIKEDSIDCTLTDSWGGSYIVFEKEYPAGEYTFSVDKMKDGVAQETSLLLSAEPSSHTTETMIFNEYYKNYLLKHKADNLKRFITFKIDVPFKVGIPFGGDADVIGEVLSIKNIQMEHGASATSYEPYTGGKPSPSQEYPQPIDVINHPVTVTVTGDTESQSITLMPPQPLTKWDKLEKVDGVWMWVYQSRHIEAYAGENISGEYISTTGGLDTGAEVYYKTTAQSIPLSPSEQEQLNDITMYAPETEVTNNADAEMELTYTVDTKSYVDSKIAAISAAVLEA